jgi:hypothetical protein
MINNSKIADGQFRNANIQRHPEFEPFLVFNDIPGQPDIYFKSMYEDDKWCIKHKGIAPRTLAARQPAIYYFPENPDDKYIKVKKGSFARLPHAFYTAHTLDGGAGRYNVREEKNL